MKPLDSILPDCIIFDLGGVVVDINIMKSFDKLASFSSHNHIKAQDIANHPLFHKFERGLSEEEEFINGLREMLATDVHNQELIESWNAMILDTPLDRLRLIKEISSKIPVYAFSNTNSLHIEFLDAMLEQKHGYKSVADFFTKAFYSHEMGHRKPDPESYEWVIKQGRMEGKNVLFLDDNLTNVEAAEKAGMKGWHITSPQEWIEYFSRWMK